MVQMDILGPFYVENSAQKNYFISCEDDCSTRKVTRNALKEKEECRCTRCTGRLHVENGKPEKVMHDNGKQFKSKIFRRFLKKNNVKDKSIPARYPQLLQGKIEVYNKIVKNEFLAVENITDVEEGKIRYSMFIKSYNEEREHMLVSMVIHHMKCFI
jgi:transposase InsO family protein